MFVRVLSVLKNTSYYIISYEDGKEAQICIFNDHVFRLQFKDAGVYLDHPKPHDISHVAKIVCKPLDDYDRTAFEGSKLINTNGEFVIKTNVINIVIEERSGLMKVSRVCNDEVVLRELKPILFEGGQSKQILFQNPDEYFYGGGTQNGRFSLKGEVIEIVNTNQWDDGGVASPNPFFWSSNGYGSLRHTWTPGLYNFKDIKNGLVEVSHLSRSFDAFYFINDKPEGIFQDYYELTGKPILMPKYAFYQSHFNAYNRDYWVKVTDLNSKGGIKFEDGNAYIEFKPQDLGSCHGILESLNGERSNYQFSARAVIDRYKKHDMPLGWFIPNDGYGAGYGQSDTLEGDISNLKEFVDYCESNGVKVGLWTESNLYPVDELNPKKGDRDIAKEVAAGVVALKTDEAWVGSGYSFGLNGIDDAASVFVDKTRGDVRPMIVTVDGWAGTQRYGAVWTGDQTGGNWENIRFHIPTLIGTSLSGQPNVGADMDGIFGGGDREVNIREFQWKAFVPIQMNMDGWGWNPKTPFEFDQDATDINRAYLKLKSMLMPYNYSVAFEAVNGLPMIRSMCLEFPQGSSSHSKDSQYQFMFGPSLLIAPIYNGVKDSNGESLRDGLYLPEFKQIWIDFLTGDKYIGGHIINNLTVPLWKLPVFVRYGAIIPITNSNNNPSEINENRRDILFYPSGETQFILYEDDGLSTKYLQGEYAQTVIKCTGPKSGKRGNVLIYINKTVGCFKGQIKTKLTNIYIMSSCAPKSVKITVNNELIVPKRAASQTDFENSDIAWFYNDKFVLNKYLSQVSQKLFLTFILIKIGQINVNTSNLIVLVEGFENRSHLQFNESEVDRELPMPLDVEVVEDELTYCQLSLQWSSVKNAVSYDVERDGTIFKNIRANQITFNNFWPSTSHFFRVRSVSKGTVSSWSNFVKGTTGDDPYRHLISGVKAICNYPQQSREGIINLTVNNNRIWHTHWETGIYTPGNGMICLIFDLGSVYDVDRMTYTPRSDAGNGTILELVYRTSLDQIEWNTFSDNILWSEDSLCKTIGIDRTARYVEIKILQSVGNFGSGKKILFYKKEEK